MAKKSAKRKQKSFTKKVAQTLEYSSKSNLSLDAMIKQLGLHDKAKGSLLDSLQYLTKKGLVKKHKDNSYSWRGVKKVPKAIKKFPPFVIGIVDITRSGFAYIISDALKDDVLVKQREINRAFDGDVVKVEVLPGYRRSKVEGRIIEIIERKRTLFSGTVSIAEGGFAFFLPDDPKIYVDFFISAKHLNNAKDGEKVVIEMLEWPKSRKSPSAKVIKVLGESGENNTEMQSILVNAGFALEFSKEVMKTALSIPMEIPSSEIKKRRDFREIRTCTIDPHDAKDFDDALSLQKLENGNWEIGVHIADVSHYVREGTALDKEAYDRATSVYLVDRVLPMLPEHISNGVCSLRPEEEKLCFSAVFEMNDQAEILKEWFGRTVIYSDKRFTYEEAQELIEGKEGDFGEEVRTLDSLSKILRKARYKNGSISFEIPEVKFRLDEKGKPIDVYTKERKDAHMMIEDFMLLANKKVASFMFSRTVKGKQPPFVYRIHDNPKEDRFESFANMAKKFGHAMNVDANNPAAITKAMNKLMEKIKGKPEQNILESLAVRSMAKAIYSTENLGHFGLSFMYYTHFTSPIRRYPDLMVHRLLAKYLEGKADFGKERLAEQCAHTSKMEKQAQEAERESSKYKQVEYMSERLGEEFDGVISGVASFGVFVECDGNKCEGMIRMNDLPDDRYFFDEADFAAVGFKSGRKFRLGEKIRVQVVGTNLEERNIDFVVAEKGN